MRSRKHCATDPRVVSVAFNSASDRGTMADLCKACGESLSEKKGDRKSLTGDAAGVRSVYGILMLFLTEGCPRYQPSVYHEYLSKEPAFVCKSCFNLLKKYSDMRDNLERMRSRITRDFNMSCSSDVSQHRNIIML